MLGTTEHVYEVPHEIKNIVDQEMGIIQGELWNEFHITMT